MTKAKAESNPATDPLTIEMRRGDKFVNVEITDDNDLRSSSYRSSVVSSLAEGMAALGAIWPPLTEERTRELALDYARRLVSGESMNPDQAALDYGVSYEEATLIAALASSATVTLP